MEFPAPRSFKLLFFLAFMHRSGSELLLSLLNSTGRLGGLDESLPPELSQGFGSTKLCAPKSLEKEAPWGKKVSIFEIAILERFFEEANLEKTAVKWIWLRRRNKVRQALSWLIAQKTGISGLTPDGPVGQSEALLKQADIEEGELSYHTIRFMLSDQTWENFFRLNQIEPYTLFYEDFIDPLTWEMTVASILDFLEVDYQLPLNPTTMFLKQSKDDEMPEVYKKVINYASRGVSQEYLF